jgi:DNA primase large subunit
MGPQAQKGVADLQEQVAKLKALVDAGAKAMEGKTFQDLTEEDRAKMKERSTEQQKIMAAIQMDVDRLRLGQMAREYPQSMTALKDAQASAEKENAKETAQKLGQIIAEREKQMEEKVTAMGMTMDDLQKMGTRGGGRRQQ